MVAVGYQTHLGETNGSCRLSDTSEGKQMVVVGYQTHLGETNGSCRLSDPSGGKQMVVVGYQTHLGEKTDLISLGRCSYYVVRFN